MAYTTLTSTIATSLGDELPRQGFICGPVNALCRLLQKVNGDAHHQWPSVEHMDVQINRSTEASCPRGAHVLVAQQFLERADVLAALQQVSGKAMAADCLPHPSGTVPHSRLAAPLLDRCDASRLIVHLVNVKEPISHCS
jgi:hypothetical protein